MADRFKGCRALQRLQKKVNCRKMDVMLLTFFSPNSTQMLISACCRQVKVACGCLPSLVPEVYVSFTCAENGPDSGALSSQAQRRKHISSIVFCLLTCVSWPPPSCCNPPDLMHRTTAAFCTIKL